MPHCARSLDVLLEQINDLYPNRSKATDGWIGDPAHAARVSDHNPDENGIVHARDFTHDPDGGLDCAWLAAVLIRSDDVRIRYIIWDYKIWEPDSGWSSYNGASPHTEHLHLSVVYAAVSDTSTPWNLGVDDMPTPGELWNYKNKRVTPVDAFQMLADARKDAERAHAISDQNQREIRELQKSVDALTKLVKGLTP